MCSVLAAQGYVLHNYPRIPLPGEPTSTKAKGIASLTKKQREILAESLDHPTNPLRFEKVSQADHMRTVLFTFLNCTFLICNILCSPEEV